MASIFRLTMGREMSGWGGEGAFRGISWPW